MFNNSLTNLEKKALLIALAHFSPTTTININSILFKNKLHRQVSIINKEKDLKFIFNINNYLKPKGLLETMLNKVFEEYNFICKPINNDIDLLNNFALLSNELIQNSKEQFNSIITFNENPNQLISKLQAISDYYTLTIHINKNISKTEKTCLVLVRHIIDNVISGLLFKDGIELLDFLNGTRIISDLLSLNASLYDENTYYRFYQQYN